VKRSLSQGGGYLQIDHRNSPGLTPEDVAHVPGAQAVGPGQNFETDVHQCSHCERGVLSHPLRKRPRAVCPKCYHFVCDLCKGIFDKTGECRPVRARLDKLQEKAAKGPEVKIVLTDVL
jgi:hypothetical protein